MWVIVFTDDKGKETEVKINYSFSKERLQAHVDYFNEMEKKYDNPWVWEVREVSND